MTENPQERIRQYNELVRQYEALSAQVQQSLSGEQRNAAELAQYRELARQRDELFSEIRAMEQELFEDGDA